MKLKQFNDEFKKIKDVQVISNRQKDLLIYKATQSFCKINNKIKNKKII